MTKSKTEYKRLNRTSGMNELLDRTLDPMFKKRGFASRDIITHWSSIVPEPYAELTMPDKLSWPRRTAGAEGATLYLRCAPSIALAVSHDGENIAAAINRYFGYILVGKVKLSAEPFRPGSDDKDEITPIVDPEIEKRTQDAVRGVEDDALRTALQNLGKGILQKKRK